MSSDLIGPLDLRWLSTFYATGSWTPVWAGNITAGTYTYTTQYGRYIRIGSEVRFRGRLTISAITGAPAGTVMYINGLPFAAENIANQYGDIAIGWASNINLSAGAVQLMGHITPGDSRITLAQMFDNAGATGLLPAEFTNAAADIIFEGSYLIG